MNTLKEHVNSSTTAGNCSKLEFMHSSSHKPHQTFPNVTILCSCEGRVHTLHPSCLLAPLHFQRSYLHD
uniref:Uncharacterized protein n=1 Tax=Setaria italica TaxID=4555 RepID=K3XU28_SETIT